MDKEAQEKIEQAIESVMCCTIPRAVSVAALKAIKKLGYRKLEGEPPLLSDEKIRKAIGAETKRIFTLMDELALDYVHHSWWNQWLLFRNALAKKIIENPEGIM